MGWLFLFLFVINLLVLKDKSGGTLYIFLYCQQILKKILKNTSVNHTVTVFDMFLYYDEHRHCRVL